MYKERFNMADANWIRSVELLVVGALLGGLFVSSRQHSAALAQPDNPQANPATLQEDVAHLKEIAPPNSHPMVEVGMFAANLWFAGEKQNWPLANYYLNETRNRIRWEVHLNPRPRGYDGDPLDMQSIFDGIDNGSIATVRKSIEMKDSQQFVMAYKGLLADCYSCHKAAARPYLRPMIPVSGAQPILNLDPAAAWPE
jgi:hypothetical protein